MSTLQLALDSAPSTVTVLAGTGFFDTATEKIGDLGTLFRALAAVAGMGFVVFQAISSRGAIARILISGLAAGLFVWIVFNVTDLQNRVDDEVNAAGVSRSQPATAAAQPDELPADQLPVSQPIAPRATARL